MAAKPLPSPELLRQLITYHPKTGEFFWRVRSAEHFLDDAKRASGKCKNWNARFAGKQAFIANNGHGYLSSYVLGKKIYAHRAAWVIFHGYWPEDQIDHINGNRSDNRISNLRAVTSSVNMRNAAIRKDNKSGQPGVSFAKIQNLWVCRYRTTRGADKSLYFKRKTDAIAARKAAEKEHGYHPNHGRAN